MSLLDTASLVVTPNGTKAGKLYSVVPSSGAGDLDVTRATTATRVNSSGLIESVASNVPRLDYTNGSCPSILVEPQRTNLVTYSEDFANAVWGKASNGTATISVTSNATTAPDGTNTADLVTLNRGFVNEYSLIYKQSNTGAGTFKGSIWLKAKDSASVGKTIDLWSYEGSNKGYTQITLTANWVRHEQVTTVFTSTGDELLNFGLLPIPVGSSSTLSVEFYAWGAQSEAGSYATSYIPTTSASVTRNADVISKTGISSLIGQTEGTLFVDFDYDGVSNNYILMQLFDSSTPFNRIELYLNSLKKIFFQAVGSGAGSISDTNILSIGRNKIAGAYKNNDFVLYINGTQIGTDMSGSVIATNSITLNDLYAIPSIYKQVMDINLSALWKTRLTNTQLAQLTTI